MIDNKDERYSISQFSTVLGVNAQTLRYYERMGIISSKRADNGYRYYSSTDSRRFMECRRLSALGLTLSEAKQMLDGGDISEQAELVRNKHREIAEEIDRLKSTLYMQRAFLDDCCEIKENTDVYRIVPTPRPAHRMRLSDGEEPLLNSELGEISRRIIEQMPCALQSAEVEGLSVDDCDALPAAYNWGMLIPDEFLCDPVLKSSMQPLPMAKEYGTCVRRCANDTFPGKSFTPLLQYVKSKGYAVAGNGIAILMPTDYRNGMSRYFKLYLPIAKID